MACLFVENNDLEKKIRVKNKVGIFYGNLSESKK